jgi:hypothetical protein
VPPTEFPRIENIFYLVEREPVAPDWLVNIDVSK